MEDKVLELAKSLCHGQADETLLSALCREACRRIDSRLSAGVQAALTPLPAPERNLSV